MSAVEKVLEISRRQHNGLTPKEMAADLATEGWQRKQDDGKKRNWQTREDGKKIKEVKKGSKSQMGESVLDELATATLRAYVGKATQSSSKAYSKGDKPTIKKRVKGVNQALSKLHPKK